MRLSVVCFFQKRDNQPLIYSKDKVSPSSAKISWTIDDSNTTIIVYYDINTCHIILFLWYNTTLSYWKDGRNQYINSSIYHSVAYHMARTNKRGIAANKAKSQKQAARLRGGKRFEYPKRKLTLEEAKSLSIVGVVTNQKGNDYNRFLRGRKVCRETRLRVDPDGYRYVRTPAGWSESVAVTMNGWTRKKLIKTTRQR